MMPIPTAGRTLMSDDALRGIIHFATHEALPPAENTSAGVQARAYIQVQIADFVIGAIRAREHGADSFGGLWFEDGPATSGVSESAVEREAIRNYLLACSAEADRQRLNMQASGHNMMARDCKAEAKAYANAAAMIEREDHASHRATLAGLPMLVSAGVREGVLEEAARAVEALRRKVPYDHNRHPCTTTMKAGAAAIRALAKPSADTGAQTPPYTPAVVESGQADGLTREVLARTVYGVLSRANINAYLDMPSETAELVADAILALSPAALPSTREGSWMPITDAANGSLCVGAFRGYRGNWQVADLGRIRDGVFTNSLGSWDAVSLVLPMPDLPATLTPTSRSAEA